MFENYNVKILVVGIVLGGMLSFGTYLFLSPSQSAYAGHDSTSYLKVKMAIEACLNGAIISEGKIRTVCE